MSDEVPVLPPGIAPLGPPKSTITKDPKTCKHPEYKNNRCTSCNKGWV